MKKSLKEKIRLRRVSKPWLKIYKKLSLPESIDYPDISMYELIRRTSEKYPTNIAYEYFGKNVTYKRFLIKVDNAARGFKALGINKSDTVTICMPNTPEGIISFYALNKIGAIANMVHPLSSENEIEFYLNKSHSKACVVIDMAFEKISKVVPNTKVEKIIVAPVSADMRPIKKFLYWFFKGRKYEISKEDNIFTWSEFIENGYTVDNDINEKVGAHDPAVILYSGGTTGTPKGIILSNLNFNAEAYGAHTMCDPSKEKDIVLSIMPIFHGFGIGVCIHTPLHIGMKCVLIPAFNAKKFYDLIKKHKPNFIVGVPTLFEALTNNTKIGPHDLSSLTCLVSGGDNLSAALKHKVDDFLHSHGCNAELRQGYGLTEASGASCLTPTKMYKNGSIGIPFPDVLYKIVKIGTHDECDYNEDGEICISGPTVMMGYLDNEAETAQTLRVHEDKLLWLHTGDIGSMDEDGYVYFKQRLKRVIISSGYNIYPSYIEDILNSHPDILTSTVIGIPHPYKVSVAKAIIVLNDGISATEAVKKSIKNHCKKNISTYALPYEYEFRKSLPKTLVGKVSYAKLMEEERNKK